MLFGNFDFIFYLLDIKVLLICYQLLNLNLTYVKKKLLHKFII